MTMVILTVMVFAALVSAQNTNTSNQANQMPSSSSGQMSNNTQWSANQPASRTMMHKMNQTKEGSYTMTENLWKQNRDLYDQWSKINEHYASMMKITDPNQLHTEMNRHQDMLNDYNQKLMSYQNDWQKYMSAIQPPSTSGKNVNSNTNSRKNMNLPTDNPPLSQPGQHNGLEN